MTRPMETPRSAKKRRAWIRELYAANVSYGEIIKEVTVGDPMRRIYPCRPERVAQYIGWLDAQARIAEQPEVASSRESLRSILRDNLACTVMMRDKAARKGDVRGVAETAKTVNQTVDRLGKLDGLWKLLVETTTIDVRVMTPAELALLSNDELDALETLYNKLERIAASRAKALGAGDPAAPEWDPAAH